MIAPDRLEPYGVSLRLRGDLADPAALVAGLLEDVAAACEHSGASVIGHLKAHARTADGAFHCNLTSVRSGARCAGPFAADGAPDPGTGTMVTAGAAVSAGADSVAQTGAPAPAPADSVQAADPAARAGADSLDLDLAVLVYGLPHATVAALVEAAVEGLRSRGLEDWVRRPPAEHDHHTHDH